jgi:hypothetical protein
LLAIGCAVQLAALPAHAAPTTPAKAGEARAAVTLPFDPPAGTPLRYSFERRVEARGQVQIMRSTEVLTFTRTPTGWSLRWLTEAAEMEAPGAMQPVLNAIARIGVGQVMLLSIDANGAVTGIDNLPEMRTVTDKMMKSMIAQFDAQIAGRPAEERAMMGRIFAALSEQQRAQSDEQFAQSLLESVALLLHGSPRLIPGQPQSQRVEQPAQIGDGTLRYLVKTELVDWQPGTSARLVNSSVADPEDAQRFAKELIKRMFATITDPKQRAEAEAATASLPPLAVNDETVQEIALPSGLVERARYAKTTAIPGQPTRTETRQYQRVK